MASIHKEIDIAAGPDHVWDALRDFGAIHERLVPGFVTDATLDGDERVVTFFTGAVAREVLVARDDNARRMVYSVTESPLGLTHHNAAAQVIGDGNGGTRFLWTADVLPHDAADRINELMEHGIAVIKRTMEAP